MDSLSARGAHQGVVVQRRDDRHALRASQRGKVERQIEEAVHVKHIRLHGAHHVRNPVEHHRRPVGLNE